MLRHHKGPMDHTPQQLMNNSSIHKLEWREGDVPVSVKFDDPFFSKQDGRAETRHVFIDGNNLPQRFDNCPQFHIGELGFGTGLNFLETWSLWKKTRQKDQALHFVSIEAFPITEMEMERALKSWDDLGEQASTLLNKWADVRKQRVLMDDQTTLQVLECDVVEALKRFPHSVDAWYLDGFSPSKNPDMWSEEVFQQLAAKTASAGTFATYTSAGWVRRNIEAAGFSAERVAGFGRKRHMTIGQLNSFTKNTSDILL